jgi:hypothetical protein
MNIFNLKIPFLKLKGHNFFGIIFKIMSIEFNIYLNFCYIVRMQNVIAQSIMI